MIKLMKFYSDNCGPCRAMTYIVDSETEQLGVELDTINISTESGINLARSMSIRQVPTFVIIKDDKTVGIKTGAMSREAFREFLVEHI